MSADTHQHRRDYEVNGQWRCICGAVPDNKGNWVTPLDPGQAALVADFLEPRVSLSRWSPFPEIIAKLRAQGDSR